MKNSSIALFLAAACALSGFKFEVRAETGNKCSRYNDAVTSGFGGSVPIVPGALLTNWKLALECLVPIIADLKNTMRADFVPAFTRAKFLSVTGAIRSMANTISAAAKAKEAEAKTKENDAGCPKKESEDPVQMFKDQFRKVANVDTYAVLVTGTRSADYDMRLSASLLLFSVMEPRYACIPLVQILDPNLEKASYFIKARANLLGVLTGIAPFVYREDNANITNVLNVIAPTVPPDDHNLDQTRQLIGNVRDRLEPEPFKKQTAPDKQQCQEKQPPPLPPAYTRSLDGDFKDRCIKYMQTYPTNEQMRANIKYR